MGKETKCILMKSESKSWRILLIEDNADDRIIATRILKRYESSTQVIGVKTGSEALSALTSENPPFDCVLLDLGLPDMDGREVLAELAAKNLPVIVLTGTDCVELGEELIREGAQDYLVKGNTLGPLLCRTIRYAMKRHLLHLKLQSANQLERKLAQELQSQSDKKDKFLAQIAHELRTPLNALTQFLEIVEGGGAGTINDEQREYLGISLRNARSLKDLISDLLDVVRAQNNKLTLTPQCIAISEILDESLPVSKEIAKAKDISITLDMHDDLPPVWADSSRVQQVIQNLSGNAIKFGPRGMPLKIRVSLSKQDSNMLQIDVEDKGPGINPDRTDAIFDPLHQEEDILADAARQGLGLGLYICKELVCQHGGRIWVNSVPEKGSTFSFTLPCFDLKKCLREKIQEDGRFNDGTALLTFAIDPNGRDSDRSSFSTKQAHRRFRNALSLCTRANNDVILPGSLLREDRPEVISLLLANCNKMGGTKLIRRCRQEFKAIRDQKVPLISYAEISGEKLTTLFASFDQSGANTNNQ